MRPLTNKKGALAYKPNMPIKPQIKQGSMGKLFSFKCFFLKKLSKPYVH